MTRLDFFSTKIRKIAKSNTRRSDQSLDAGICFGDKGYITVKDVKITTTTYNMLTGLENTRY